MIGVFEHVPIDDANEAALFAPKVTHVAFKVIVGHAQNLPASLLDEPLSARVKLVGVEIQRRRLGWGSESVRDVGLINDLPKENRANRVDRGAFRVNALIEVIVTFVIFLNI